MHILWELYILVDGVEVVASSISSCIEQHSLTFQELWLGTV